MWLSAPLSLVLPATAQTCMQAVTGAVGKMLLVTQFGFMVGEVYLDYQGH